MLLIAELTDRRETGDVGREDGVPKAKRATWPWMLRVRNLCVKSKSTCTRKNPCENCWPKKYRIGRCDYPDPKWDAWELRWVNNPSEKRPGIGFVQFYFVEKRVDQNTPADQNTTRACSFCGNKYFPSESPSKLVFHWIRVAGTNREVTLLFSKSRKSGQTGEFEFWDFLLPPGSSLPKEEKESNCHPSLKADIRYFVQCLFDLKQDK